MRCTQFIGLNDKAVKYLANNCVKIEQKKCHTCGHVSGGELIEHTYDLVTGMFEEEVADLHIYNHKKGGKVKEVIQAEPWSGGPVIFLCLKYKNRLICKWAKSKIDNC